MERPDGDGGLQRSRLRLEPAVSAGPDPTAMSGLRRISGVPHRNYPFWGICGTADMLDNDRNFGQYPAVKSQECHIGRACHAQSDRRKPP